MNSQARDKSELASEITESKHQRCCGFREILNHEFLKLVKIRDFVSLILTYPMKMPGQQLLEKWRDEAQAITAEYSEQPDSIGTKAYCWMHLLSEYPLRYMEVLIPNDILNKIEDGQTSISIFNENAATPSAEVIASTSTSKGKQVLELGAILNLSAGLAVDQLIQNLLSCNIHHVRFFIRNNIERRYVVEKMKAALNRKQHRQKINAKYSRVIWIDVSNYGDYKEIHVRQEIARQLNLKTTEDDETEGSAFWLKPEESISDDESEDSDIWLKPEETISDDETEDTENLLAAQQIEDTNIMHRRLTEEEMMRRNHLVFLVDGDGKRKLDYRKVCFPGKTLAGSVVLITTESLEQESDELRMSMDLEIRTDDHMLPWVLFCKNVGGELVQSSNDIRKIAVQIVEECGGHLLAIALVAKSLKNKEDVQIWKLALEKLRRPYLFSANKIADEISKVMVNAFVNISLDGLNDKEKLCLASSLYVLKIGGKLTDHVLISSWVYNKIVNTQEEAELVLRNLVARSVLLQSEGRYIQWSEEIYNILKSLLELYESSGIIRRGGLGLTEPPTTEEWHGAKQIELEDNRLSDLKLLESPNCPELRVLCLRGNTILMKIPTSFFALMPKLQSLDLSYTSIRSLPSSIFGLNELTELRLKGCKGFMELPREIGQVKSLEILDVEGTPLIFLPEEIKELINLQELSLSFYKYDQCHPIMIPAGVISELKKLRSLSIGVSPEDKRWYKNVKVILQEISELTNLRRVSLYIPEVELLKHVHRKLWDCKLIVGRHKEPIISRAPPTTEEKFRQSNCSLKFVNGVEIPNEIIEFMRHTRTQALFLNRHKTIKNLFEFGEANLLHRHRICIVGECNEMQTLIVEGCHPYLTMEFLCAFYMGNLRSICEVAAVSFNFLRNIALHSCPKLTTILNSDFVESLSSLSEIIVDDCPKVRTLISVRESFELDEGRSLLPRLKKVTLLYLPELVSISNGLRIGSWLERIECYECPKLESLSAAELCSLNLKEIRGEKKWWEALKWEEAEWGNEGCPNDLDAIFSPINEEEANIVNQLLQYDEECYGSKKKTWVENVEKKLKEQQSSSSPQQKFFTMTEFQLLPSYGEDKISKQMISEARDKDVLASPEIKEIPNHDFLRLMRIRDFLSLILTYHMSMPDQHSLEKWRDEAQALTSKYSEHTVHSTCTHLLSQNPLRYMEVLIPNDILSKIEDGQAYIFKEENAATPSVEVIASTSTSKGKQVSNSKSTDDDVLDVIPEAILNLVVDLAVDQLIQNLLQCNVHHVRFFIRNGIVQQTVRRMKATLNRMKKKEKFKAKYSRIYWINLPIYGDKDNTEVQVRLEIARQLHLKTIRDDETEDTDIMLTRLIEEEMMRMNHLVFLVDQDGKRSKLDPRKLGFPKTTLAGVVVLITTTESLAQQENDELRMLMDLEIRTDDHLLPWELFCRNVGMELVRSSSEIQRIAVQIVEECGSHLLAIFLLARFLKNMEDVVVWKHTLEKLCFRHPFNGNKIPDHEIGKVTVKAFTIILDGLNNVEKLCLASSVYVLKMEKKMADHILMSSWVYNKIVYDQESAENILRNLVDRSILLQLEGRYIQWPKEVYYVLENIFKLYPSSQIRGGGLGLTRLPPTEEWYGADEIELGDNNLSELPECPNCPKLRLLFLQGNAFLMKIPTSFFAVMPELQVLNLSYTSIRSLPSSIFGLKKLTQLHLKGCKGLMELPPEIGQLKSLEVLNAKGTPLIFLPKEVKKLTKLQKLSLSFYKYDQYPILFPAGVILKLSELRSLKINVSPEDKRWDEMVPVITQEISKLKNLRRVSLYIPQAKLLKSLISKNLSYTLIVGRHKERIISHAPAEIEADFKGRQPRLKYVNGENIPEDIKNVLQHTESLYLERHKTIKCLSEFEMKNLWTLQTCILGECKEMHTLFDEGPLPKLRVLCAYHMSNLTRICKMKASFSCYLTYIALHSCPNLTTIFTPDFASSLSMLKDLIVEDCPKVKSLVIHDSSEGGVKECFRLPILSRVWLLHLPELVTMFGGLVVAPRLERIGFYACPRLRSLSISELYSPFLEVIKGEKEWWDALEWEDEGRPNNLDAIFSPINEEANIINQLLPRDIVEASGLEEKNTWVTDAGRKLTTYNLSFAHQSLYS